jgi:hypothetical protein
MKGYLYLILLVAPALALPAQGGIFTNKPPHPAPDTRVPGLLYTVKADPDEVKRAAAAAELREYDARLFPDIVPVLASVLHNDPKPSVRREAAISLGHFPVTPIGGKALQEASNDPSWKVRLPAWTAYKGYQLRGYHEHPVVPPPKVVGTNEPPLAHQAATYTPKTVAPSPVVASPSPLPPQTVNTSTPHQATPVSNVPAPVPSASGTEEGPVLDSKVE